MPPDRNREIPHIYGVLPYQAKPSEPLWKTMFFARSTKRKSHGVGVKIEFSTYALLPIMMTCKFNFNRKPKENSAKSSGLVF